MRSRHIDLKRYRPFIGTFFLWALTLGFSRAQTCTVNATTTYQYIHCIGASSAWSGVGSMGTQLFADDNVNGHIGLTSLRTRIDPTAVNGNTGNWNSELNNITAANAVNPNVLFWSTEWSPPAMYKSNNSVQGYVVNNGVTDVGSFTGADSANTSTPNSADTGYAQYLTQYVQYCKSYTGVDLYAVSAQNEPSFVVNYEGASWTSGQFDIFVKSLAASITSAGLSTKIMMPEPPNEWGMGLGTATMADPNAAPLVSIIATHLYGSFYDTLSQIAANNGYTHLTNQEFWATEISGCSTGLITSQVSAGMCVASWAHQSLVEGQMNGFHYWWLNDLINGTSLTDAAFALGNFAKFIRPGYYRMGATEGPQAGVTISAYKNTNNSSPTTFVIVAINYNANSVNQTFNLTGLTTTSVTPWLTDKGTGLVQQAAVPVSGNSFTYSMPVSSIVSFVGINNAGPTATPTATPGCTPAVIAPNVQVNGGAWTNTNIATVSEGATVNLGPQPLTGGTWSWTGPNGFTSTSREIDGISLSVGTNSFVATNTQPGGCNSSETFTITVTAPTATPTNTLTNTGTSTATNTRTSTPTNTATNTVTNTATSTATDTRTSTPTNTATATSTNTATNTATHTTTNTPTNTSTNTATVTLTNTATSTLTNTLTNTATATFTNTVTNTVTHTATNTPTYTSTASSTATNTPTSTVTNSATRTATTTTTNTATQTSTNTSTLTPANTGTFTNTATHTPTVTSSPTATDTFTHTTTPTITPTYTETTTSSIIISEPYPNPSNGTPITINIQVPGESTVTLDVFTLAFRRIYSDTTQADGPLTLQWDLKDISGVQVANGLYYIRIHVAGSQSTTKILKVLVLR